MKKINSMTVSGGQDIFLALILLIILFACLSAAKSAEAETAFADGQLFLANGQPITIEEFAAQAAGADYVLIGETHDAPHHHLMQANLLKSLAEAGLRPAVGFEMLYFRNQHLLEDFNQRKIKLGELEAASGWSKSWSYPFEIYAPIFQVAENFDLPVHGLNISKATLDLVKADGFDQAHKNNAQEQIPDLPKEVIWPKPEQVAHLNKIREGLASRQQQQKPDDKAAEPASPNPPETEKPKAGDPRRFLLVQSLWDTSMAESAVKAHEKTGRPVVIIAGSGHVESGYGIAHRINTLTPGKKILLVLPLASPFRNEDPRKNSADVFFASRPSLLSLGLVFKAEPDYIIIDEVKNSSRAESAGLQIGDRIISLEEKDLKSPGDFHSAMAIADLQDKRSGAAEKRAKTLIVERNGIKQSLTLY